MHPIYTSMLVKFYSCKKRVLHQFSLLCLSVVACRPWVIDHFPSKVTYFPPSVRSRQTRHRGRSGHGSAWWPRVVRMPGCTRLAWAGERPPRGPSSLDHGLAGHCGPGPPEAERNSAFYQFPFDLFQIKFEFRFELSSNPNWICSNVGTWLIYFQIWNPSS
jgi:hypothetical protein